MFMVPNRSVLPLKGRRILVTRPFRQAAGLVELIEQQGGDAIVFPVIEIAANYVKEWSEWHPLQTNWLVFVSRNAVEHFLQGSPQTLPAHIKLAATGEGTAQTMRENRLTVDLQPELSNGSEGLLQLPEWQQMDQQHVVIVRGDGGRELMAETLRARGAKISYLEVYRRQLPTVSADLQQQACSADWLTATSANGVTNLLSLLSTNCPEILQKPLVVVSERIKAFAIEKGFKQVHVSLDASDGAIIQRLIEMGSDHGA
jgi:uroporphyrinogen-III synthase